MNIMILANNNNIYVNIIMLVYDEFIELVRYFLL